MGSNPTFRIYLSSHCGGGDFYRVRHSFCFRQRLCLALFLYMGCGMRDMNLVLNLICLFSESKGNGDRHLQANKVEFKLLPTGDSYVSEADISISGSGVNHLYYVRDDSKGSMYMRVSLDGYKDITFDFYRDIVEDIKSKGDGFDIELWYLLRATMFRWFGKLGIMNKHQLGDDDYDNFEKFFGYDTLED